MATHSSAGQHSRPDGAFRSFEHAQYLEAAELALIAYPGALGELVHRELRAFAEFGYRLAGDELIKQLAGEVLAEVRERGGMRTETGGTR